LRLSEPGSILVEEALVSGDRQAWFPRLLFGLTLAAAGGLLGLVWLSPWLVDGNVQPDGWNRVVALFAQDTTVRRTAVGSAIGALVTACIFFGPAGSARSGSAKSRPPRRPPPQNVAGA